MTGTGRTQIQVLDVDLVSQVVQGGDWPEGVYGDGLKESKGIIGGADEQRKMVRMVNPLAPAYTAWAASRNGMTRMTKQKALTCGCRSASSTTVST